MNTSFLLPRPTGVHPINKVGAEDIVLRRMLMEERQNREKEHLDLKTFAVNMAHHFGYDRRLLSIDLQGFGGFTERSDWCLRFLGIPPFDSSRFPVLWDKTDTIGLAAPRTTRSKCKLVTLLLEVVTSKGKIVNGRERSISFLVPESMVLCLSLTVPWCHCACETF